VIFVIVKPLFGFDLSDGAGQGASAVANGAAAIGQHTMNGESRVATARDRALTDARAGAAALGQSAAAIGHHRCVSRPANHGEAVLHIAVVRALTVTLFDCVNSMSIPSALVKSSVSAVGRRVTPFLPWRL
jgi:hypothetical protein